MSFIYENIRNWLLKEIMESGDPYLFLPYVQDALEEIVEEGLIAKELLRLSDLEEE